MNLHRRMLALTADAPRLRRRLGMSAVVGLAVAAPALMSAGAGAGITRQTSDGAIVVTPTVLVETVDENDEFGVRQLRLDLAAAGADRSSVIRVELDDRPEFLSIDRIGRLDTGLAVTIRARTADGWSAPAGMYDEGSDAPDGLTGEEGANGSVATAPIWLGRDVLEIELDFAGAAPPVVQIETLDDLAGPTPPRAAAIVGTPAASVTSPSIQPRGAWTTETFAFHNEDCDDGPQTADDLRVAVVHHTVTTNSYNAGDVPAQIRAIRRTHVDRNGWCDIGYNFIVDRFGTVWEARAGGVDQPIIGAHTRGFNTGAVGVALLGSFQSGAGSPTSAMTDGAASVIGWKLALHGLDPRGLSELQNRSSGPGMKFAERQIIRMPTILGHRDLGHTSCPGANGYNVVTAIRSRVAAQQDLSAPYDFPGFRPLEAGPAVWLVDHDGGVRAAGAAPIESSVTSPGIVAGAGNDTGAAVLTEDGRVVGLGSWSGRGWSGANVGVAVDVAAAADGGGGWIARANGSVSGFGSLGTPSVDRRSTAAAVAVVRFDDGRGSLLHSDGVVSPIDGGPAGAAGGASVDLAVHPDGGVSVLRSDGSVVGIAGAPSWGAPVHLGRPVAVMIAPYGHGGWVADAEGRLEGVGTENSVTPISTHVGTERVTDAVHLGYSLGRGGDLADSVKYARQLQRTFLGTEPTTAELSFLTRRLTRESTTSVVEEFVFSDAWAGAMVDDLYVRSLGRGPDAAGRAYWIGQLAGDLVFANAGVFFFGSAEYRLTAGSDEQFVRNLYRDLLGRDADAAGLEYWTARMAEGSAAPPDVASGFYVSPESRGIRVDELHRAMFGRTPDAATRSELAEQLLLMDDMDLAVFLALSDEFEAHALG